ncbi:hypothetical protein [Saccharothrix obliqua]|uniref:hypothetical protein n=1 Tax=Saccharothrix obliqua TaxID=2861747 RepID=UPI001C604407|nr:hypothetical protein [Saccharothrix obliqua]MBW4715709.1 hypothetical protein [Saccharothrix obliqua]
MTDHRGAATPSRLSLTLAGNVPVTLRGTTSGRLFVTIDHEVEILLEESHLRALTAQAGTALRDAAAVDAAEQVVSDVWDAGAQARTAAAAARERAEVARRAGADAEAEQALEAARLALEAADRAQHAVRAAFDLMDEADEATRDAVRAAAGGY